MKQPLERVANTTCNLSPNDWPPVLVPTGTKPATKIPGIPGTFGVIMRKDGSQQLTYDRAPLYTFAEVFRL
jgi:predicted lipoprotein with Yx(FWY)xxD motif